MNEKIKRNTDSRQGPLDGVQATVNSVITIFEKGKQGSSSKKPDQKTIKAQSKMSCEIFCTYSEGVISFSIRDMDFMLTVRADEMIEIFKAASEAHIELQESLSKNFETE